MKRSKAFVLQRLQLGNSAFFYFGPDTSLKKNQDLHTIALILHLDSIQGGYITVKMLRTITKQTSRENITRHIPRKEVIVIFIFLSHPFFSKGDHPGSTGFHRAMGSVGS